MWNQFVFENVHFAINMFVSLAFFSIFWLYFDAWKDRKTVKEGLKIVGLLLLALAFLVQASVLDTSNLVLSIFKEGLTENVSLVLRTSGYLFLLVGLVIDPLIKKPRLAIIIPLGLVVARWATPLLAMMVAWWYLRRATIGLENHTKKVSAAFFFFAIYELLKLCLLFVVYRNVDVYKLVAPFGLVWFLALFFEFIGALILLTWTFSYLLKRIDTQLFIIFTTLTLSVFLITTSSFSFLLLKSVSDESLASLSTDMSVMSYAVNSKKSEVMAVASMLATNKKLMDSMSNLDKKSLFGIAEETLLAQKVSTVLVVDTAGVVVARGEDKDRVGDSVFDSPVVKKSLAGESVSTLMLLDQAVLPLLQIKVSTPVKIDGKIIGAVVIGVSLDNSFLDQIKKETGLEVSIYGGSVLAATTISDIKGATRPIGTKETNKTVLLKVLGDGQEYQGLVKILNANYFAVYRPLSDLGITVGMMVVAKPAGSVVASASKAVELTFLIASALILLSVVPTFLVSNYITNQLK